MSIYHALGSASLTMNFRREGLFSFVLLHYLYLLYRCIIIFTKNPISETCSDLAPEIYFVINYNKLSSTQEHRRSTYRRGGVPRYIEKPNKAAVENAITNPPIQTPEMLGPNT